MNDLWSRARSTSGFSLTDVLLSVAVITVVSAMAVPTAQTTLGSMRLGSQVRDLERELQTARLKAVALNQPMRVRFNCPAAGQYRMVELIGTPSVPAAADSATDRCSDTVYPVVPSDRNRLTRPKNDGPVQTLGHQVAFSATSSTAALEFRPNGTAHYDDGSGTNPWPPVPVAGVVLTLVKNGSTRTITVNSVGKIQMQR